MGSNWPLEKLGNLLEITSSKRIFRADYCEVGIPFYRGKEIVELSKGNTISTELFISTEKFEKIKNKFGAPQAGDLLLTSVGTLGAAYLVQDDDRFYFKDGNLTWFRNFSDKLLPRFLLLWFRSSIAKRAIDEITIGSTQQALTIVSLKTLELALPPIKEQKKITHILGTLDDKIELNRQMNTTLEDMAQALFKSWFIDFDPVIDNALAAGNSIPEPLQARAEARVVLGEQRKSLPKAIQKQFPDGFVFDEDMGWVPERWESISMTSMVESISDTFPLNTVEQVIFLNTGDILEGNFLHSNYSKVSGLPGQAKKSIKKGDILYSEIRPKNKRFAYVDFESEDHVVSTKLMVLRSKDQFNPLFPYFVLKQNRTINLLQHLAESRSGTFPQITYQQLEQVKVMMPKNNSLIDFFESTVLKDNHKKSLRLNRESKTLTRLRDTLLPKLLSGQLHIPDAEKQLAEVI